jgi:alpha-beta hydrolase superfamily lysophospholipase
MSMASFPPTITTGKLRTEDGVSLFFRHWTPGSKGTVVLIHGLGEHSGRYVHLGEFFAQAGFAVFAFDLRGHGWSGGRPTFIKSYDDYLIDLDSAIAHLEQPDPLILFGHSLGGQLVLAYAQSDRKPPTGYIAASPWIDLSRQPVAWLVGIARILNAVAPSWPFPTGISSEDTSRDQALLDSFPDLDKIHHFIRVRTYFEITKASLQLLERPLANAPVLLTHGEADSVTSIEATKAYFEKLTAPHKTFINYPEGRHELHNDLGRQKTMNDYLEWIEARTNSGLRNADRGI